MLFYGQIGPSNYMALLSHYGHEPPWSMNNSPHISFVRAIVDGVDISKTPYADYIKRVHEDADGKILERREAVASLILSGILRVDVQVDSVVDGNHRYAVSNVLGREVIRNTITPYQTVEYGVGEVFNGRRSCGGRLDEVDVSGRVVLDLGCSIGMNSVSVAKRGAAHVYAVDVNLTSSSWKLRDSWGLQKRITFLPMDICKIKAEDNFLKDCSLVLAMSIHRHIGTGVLESLIKGKDCLYETHYHGDSHPNTGHNWKLMGEVPYSVADNVNVRDVWYGKARIE